MALLIAATFLPHFRMLVELYGRLDWVAALTPLSVYGMTVAASTMLLVAWRGRTWRETRVVLVVGGAASLVSNVAVLSPSQRRLSR